MNPTTSFARWWPLTQGGPGLPIGGTFQYIDKPRTRVSLWLPFILLYCAFALGPVVDFERLDTHRKRWAGSAKAEVAVVAVDKSRVCHAVVIVPAALPSRKTEPAGPGGHFDRLARFASTQSFRGIFNFSWLACRSSMFRPADRSLAVILT